MTEDLEIHIISLTKARKKKKKNDKLLQWLAFLDNPNNKGVLEMKKKNQDIADALWKLEEISEEVRIETKYQRDMNDDILRLDYDYLSKQSLDSLLLALKNKGIEISYTFDYSTNTYKFV